MADNVIDRVSKKARIINAVLADPEIPTDNLTEIPGVKEGYANSVRSQIINGVMTEADIIAAADMEVQGAIANEFIEDRSAETVRYVANPRGVKRFVDDIHPDAATEFREQVGNEYGTREIVINSLILKGNLKNTDIAIASSSTPQYIGNSVAKWEKGEFNDQAKDLLDPALIDKLVKLYRALGRDVSLPNKIRLPDPPESRDDSKSIDTTGDEMTEESDGRSDGSSQDDESDSYEIGPGVIPTFDEPTPDKTIIKQEPTLTDRQANAVVGSTESDDEPDPKSESDAQRLTRLHKQPNGPHVQSESDQEQAAEQTSNDEQKSRAEYARELDTVLDDPPHDENDDDERIDENDDDEDEEEPELASDEPVEPVADDSQEVAADGMASTAGIKDDLSPANSAIVDELERAYVNESRVIDKVEQIKREIEFHRTIVQREAGEDEEPDSAIILADSVIDRLDELIEEIYADGDDE